MAPLLYQKKDFFEFFLHFLSGDLPQIKFVPYGPASLSGENPQVEPPMGGFLPQKVETLQHAINYQVGGFPGVSTRQTCWSIRYCLVSTKECLFGKIISLKVW